MAVGDTTTPAVIVSNPNSLFILSAKLLPPMSHDSLARPAIWHMPVPSLEQLNSIGKNTLGDTLGMRFVEIGNDYIQMSMPVNTKTHQPFGLLHGGASAALAETIGSMAGWLTIDKEKFYCVGLEINCNHVRTKKEGMVIATAAPLHLGRSTQVWDIRIKDEEDKLVCISRLTLAVVPKG